MQPQQPYQSPMQPVFKPRKSRLQTIIFTLLVLFGVVLLLSVAAWIFLATKQSSDTGRVSPAAAQILEPEDAAPTESKIDSDLGMKLTYNNKELAGFALHETITYSGSDLTVNRPYSVVRVRPIETSQATRSEIAPGSPELRVTSSVDKEYWQQFSDKPDYKDLSKIDRVVKQTSDQRTTNKSVTTSDASVQRIGQTEYRKISYTETNEEFGLTTTVREDCYVTVSHDRPYVACINNIRASNFAVVPQLEKVITTLEYTKPDETTLVDSSVEAANADQAMLDAAKDEDVSARDQTRDEPQAGPAAKSSQSTKAATTSSLQKSSDLRTFLQAAPSTVRVGVIYCANIQLKQTDGRSGPMLTGACVNRGTSGFFISREGLVSTAASTVHVQPQEAIRSYIVDAPSVDTMHSRLDRILTYLVESRSLMESDADAIRAGIETRDQNIVDKVNTLAQIISPENITISQESYRYALELSDTPIVINTKSDGGLEFAYSDRVIEAELVAKKLSPALTTEQIQKGDFLEHDIALLQAKKAGTYPALRLATSSTVGNNALISFMGMPQYAVGTLENSQMRSTALLRQGQVAEVFNGAGAQRLLSVKSTSHAGLAGGPALDQVGHVIGVATYANANCPGSKCFGSTIIRDLVDMRALIKDRNLNVQSSSPVSETWNRAVEAMIQGNYRVAHGLFERSALLYPANYLATPYANYAKSQIGTASDTSSFNAWLKIAQIIAVISAITLILLVIIRLALRLFARPQPQSQYGQLANGNYIDATQWHHPGSPPQSEAWRNPNPYQPVQPSQLDQPWQQPPQPTYQQPTTQQWEEARPPKPPTNR